MRFRKNCFHHNVKKMDFQEIPWDEPILPICDNYLEEELSEKDDLEEINASEEYQGNVPGFDRPDPGLRPAEDPGHSEPSSGVEAFDELTEGMSDSSKLAIYEAIRKLSLSPDDVLLILMHRLGVFLDLYEKIPLKIEKASALAIENAQIPIVRMKNEAVKDIQLQANELYQELLVRIDSALAEVVDNSFDPLDMTNEEVCELFNDAVERLEKQHKKANDDLLSKISINPLTKVFEISIIVMMLVGAFQVALWLC